MAMISLIWGARALFRDGLIESRCLPPTGLCYPQNSSGRSNTNLKGSGLGKQDNLPTRLNFCWNKGFSTTWQNSKFFGPDARAAASVCLCCLIFWFPKALSLPLCLASKFLIESFPTFLQPLPPEFSGPIAHLHISSDIQYFWHHFSYHFLLPMSCPSLPPYSRLSFCHGIVSHVNMSLQLLCIPSFSLLSPPYLCVWQSCAKFKMIIATSMRELLLCISCQYLLIITNCK